MIYMKKKDERNVSGLVHAGETCQNENDTITFVLTMIKHPTFVQTRENENRNHNRNLKGKVNDEISMFFVTFFLRLLTKTKPKSFLSFSFLRHMSTSRETLHLDWSQH